MNESYEVQKAHTALAEAVSCAFEDTTFIETIQREDVEKSMGPDETRAAIDLLRPVSSRLELRIPPELSDRIKEILYGGDSEEAESRDDSILELLNIITGQFVTRYFGPGADVKLELPRYLYFYEEFEGTPVLDLGFDAEGIPFRVILGSTRYRY